MKLLCKRFFRIRLERRYNLSSTILFFKKSGDFLKNIEIAKAVRRNEIINSQNRVLLTLERRNILRSTIYFLKNLTIF
jgi:hypothetical protein